MEESFNIPSVLSKKDSSHSLSQSGSEESPLSFVLFTVVGFLPLVLCQRRLLPEDLACSYSAHRSEHGKNVLSAFEHFLLSPAKGSEATSKVSGVLSFKCNSNRSREDAFSHRLVY